ncbi:MAG: hypothetical protein PHC34_06415 [Candidatus Gastranaerophilales bacterium]|nr:hypothetical protein [Candidatus Gastranaerophilales bacterium]
MDSNLLKLYFSQNIPSKNGMPDSTTKGTRAENIVVSSSDTKLQKDIRKVKDTFEAFKTHTNDIKVEVNKYDSFITKNKDLTKTVFSSLGFVIPIRRISSVPDKLDDKDYIGTTGALAVAGFLLPEDLRDTRDGARQIIHKILPKSFQEKIKGRFPKFFDNFINYAPKYSHKEFQTPFSFLRGSFLEPLVNKMTNKYGYNLHEWDKPLLETKLGKRIMNLLKVEEVSKKSAERTVKKVIEFEGKYIVDDVEVKAIKLEGSAIGKLICRTLQRTTKYGTITLSAICLPSIINAFNKPKNIKNKLINGSKQILKSIISVVLTLSGIGLVGALLSPLGPAGSVAGMAIGSVIGAYVSTKINMNIKSKS